MAENGLSLFETWVKLRKENSMAQALAVAKQLNALNEAEYHAPMDQTVMQVMMYLCLRESVMSSEDASPLFAETFEAGKYGPVLADVAEEYQTGHMFSGDYGGLTEEESVLTDSVFVRYRHYNVMSLSLLSRSEYFWTDARRGLSPGDPRTNRMRPGAVRVDAAREKARRQGVVLRTLSCTLEAVRKRKQKEKIG